MLPWKICLLVRKQLRCSNRKSFRKLLPSNALMKPLCSALCWGLGSAAWLALDFFRGYLCVCFVIFPIPESAPITEVLEKHLQPGDPGCLGCQSSAAMTAGAWLSQNHCQLETGLLYIRVSCTLVLGKITFIVLLPAQLCCVAALWAMERWSSGAKIRIIHYLWNSCSFSKVLVALPFEDF